MTTQAMKRVSIVSLLLATLLVGTTHSFVIPPPTSKHNLDLVTRDPATDSTSNTGGPLSQLLTIVPSASSCAGAPFPSECATASTALNPIIASFATYGVTTAPEQAALLSWMAFESGEFKYNANHYPGTPGQGTRCMMGSAFVAQYVASLTSLAGQTAGKSPAQVLSLVQGDEYSFAAAAWFYSSHCSAAVKAQVQSGSRAGWVAFVSGCVGTTVDEGSGDQSREAYWRRAMGALGAPIS